MRPGSGLASDIVAAVAARVAPGVSVKRRGRRRLVVSLMPAGSAKPVTFSVPLVVYVASATTRTTAAEILLCEVISEISLRLRRKNTTWPGLADSPIRVKVDRFRDGLIAIASDHVGGVVTFPLVPLRADESPELPWSPAAAELMTELTAERFEIDSVAQWLLRVGIDHTGELALTGLWDVAVRAMVLADLKRSNRLVEATYTVQVDTSMSGLAYEDAVCEQLLKDQGRLTLEAWICRGELRAAEVAAHLVEINEWSRHTAPITVGRHKYTAPKQQYIKLRQRLAHTYDGDFDPLSDEEALLAVLGHALNVVRPRRITLEPQPASPLQPDGCGAFAELAGAADVEIKSRVAENLANNNPTW